MGVNVIHMDFNKVSDKILHGRMLWKVVSHGKSWLTGYRNGFMGEAEGGGGSVFFRLEVCGDGCG